MILGQGIDIIEIGRIKDILDEKAELFLNRIFTQQEQDYCLQYRESAQHFAGRFAAKEAIAKAIGTGIGKQLNWKDIEILPEASGRPIAFIHSMDMKNYRMHISISHCKSHACAVATYEKCLN